MRAVRGHEGRPVVVDVDEPPGEGELLTMHVGGICASDFAYLERGPTFVLGHELAGIRADGMSVMVEGMFGCGNCPFCLDGRNNVCTQSATKALGIMQDGGFVEQYRVPAHKLIELPHGLDRFGELTPVRDLRFRPPWSIRSTRFRRVLAPALVLAPTANSRAPRCCASTSAAATPSINQAVMCCRVLLRSREDLAHLV